MLSSDTTAVFYAVGCAISWVQKIINSFAEQGRLVHKTQPC